MHKGTDNLIPGDKEDAGDGWYKVTGDCTISYIEPK